MTEKYKYKCEGVGRKVIKKNRAERAERLKLTRAKYLLHKLNRKKVKQYKKEREEEKRKAREEEKRKAAKYEKMKAAEKKTLWKCFHCKKQCTTSRNLIIFDDVPFNAGIEYKRRGHQTCDVYCSDQ